MTVSSQKSTSGAHVYKKAWKNLQTIHICDDATIMSTTPKRELRSCIAAFRSRCADVKRRSEKERTRCWITHVIFSDWFDGLCVFIYSSNLYAILNKCFAVISLILKSKPAEIYAQSLTEIQDLVKDNSIVQRIVKHDFSKTFWVYLFFQNFPDPMTFPDFSWAYEPWMWRSGAVI